MGKNGMVAAEHPLDSLAGLRVLQNGGNAGDAAVAVFYMTSVTEPSEAGLGATGLFLLTKRLDRVAVITVVAALQNWLRESSIKSKVGSVPPDGPYSATMPGAVGGFDLLLKNYGTKDYPILVADAVELASNDYAVARGRLVKELIRQYDVP